MQEKKAFKWIKENIPQLKELKDANENNKYSYYDWYLSETDNNRHTIIEYKERRDTADTYPEGTLIELSKIKNMWLSDNTDHYYCITTTDHKLYFWKLKLDKDYDYNWEKKECNYRTDLKNDIGKVTKIVGYLKWEDSTAIYDLKTKQRIR